MSADERREQILACATRLFEERPHHEVSTTEIAEAAGVARPLVHHYFGTRRNLYLEVLRRLYFIPPIVPGDLEGVTLEEKVSALLARWLEGVSRHRNTWLATMRVGGPGSDPEVARIMQEADELVVGRLIQALGLDQAPGQKRLRALLVGYAGLAKASTRQWLVTGALSQADVHHLLVETLLTVLCKVHQAR